MVRFDWMKLGNWVPCSPAHPSTFFFKGVISSPSLEGSMPLREQLSSIHAFTDHKSILLSLFVFRGKGQMDDRIVWSTVIRTAGIPSGMNTQARVCGSVRILFRALSTFFIPPFGCLYRKAGGRISEVVRAPLQAS